MILKKEIKNVYAKLPSRQYWLGSLLFWLIINSLIAYNAYISKLHYDYAYTYHYLWIGYSPWWVPWALFMPLIMTFTKEIKHCKPADWRCYGINLIFCMVIMVCYWTVCLLSESFIKAGYTFSVEQIAKTFEYLVYGPLIEADLIVYICILSIGYSLSHAKSNQLALINNEILSRHLVKVELDSLRAQLNPHFLFNTLNTIASLVRLEDKEKAVSAISELSQMLRKVLENQNNQIIDIKDEIDFINSYLTIQKLRFSEKLDIKIKVDDEALKSSIPFMLLQPLVENAVQYGSQLSTDKNTVSISILAVAQQIEIRLINKISLAEKQNGFGIGIKNCRERLKKLYEKEEFTLELKTLKENYFETLLRLPRE